MLIPVLFHSFTQASPSPIASLLLSAPSFIGDIYNTGVPEQFQTLFGPPLPSALLSVPCFARPTTIWLSIELSHPGLSPLHPSALRPTPPRLPRTLSINLFIFYSKSVSLKSATLLYVARFKLTAVNFPHARTHSQLLGDSKFRG